MALPQQPISRQTLPHLRDSTERAPHRYQSFPTLLSQSHACRQRTAKEQSEARTPPHTPLRYKMDISLPPKLIYPFPMRTLGTRGNVNLYPQSFREALRNRDEEYSLRVLKSVDWEHYPRYWAWQSRIIIAFGANMPYEADVASTIASKRYKRFWMYGSYLTIPSVLSQQCSYSL